jgi:hypothetical protein
MSRHFRIPHWFYALLLLVVMWPAAAHHGWAWATDEEFEITGKIVGVKLGNPHGEVTIEVAGKHRLIEVGQPWRNEQAGLTADKLKPGW